MWLRARKPLSSESKSKAFSIRKTVSPGVERNAPKLCFGEEPFLRLANKIAIKFLAFVTQAGNFLVKSEIQQPVPPKPLNPDARASSLSESSPPKAVKV